MFKSALYYISFIKNSQWTDVNVRYSHINLSRKSNVFRCALKFCMYTIRSHDVDVDVELIKTCVNHSYPSVLLDTGIWIFNTFHNKNRKKKLQNI